MKQVIVVGGGAAGFFAAIACAEAHPSTRVVILERTSQVLGKVKISGGGRCNVTHACYEPPRLVTYYPRGSTALRGPFTKFQPQDTVRWFEDRGVALKTEKDGRIFPTSDSSQTIIDCFLSSAHKAGIEIKQQTLIRNLRRQERGGFEFLLENGETLTADAVILATGSNPDAWSWAKALGHTLSSPVPSLFTFTIKDPRLEGLSGVSVPEATVWLNSTLTQTGPLLITHWGLSGPAVLKLSAWGARVLHEKSYKADVHINWVPGMKPEALMQRLRELRATHQKKIAQSTNPTPLSKRLWIRLAETAGLSPTLKWTEVSNDHLLALAKELQDGVYSMTGKSTFKEEFVTCGGVQLDEVDFRTLESKVCPGLYFAGEILDVDGVTGGFNFQNAWTTGWLAGQAAGSPD